MSERIGQELKEARQGLDISLEQAAEETRIRAHYLQALEKGDFARLPSKAHIRGFLRAYAGYLGLDSTTLLIDLDQNERPVQDIDIQEQPEPEPDVEKVPGESSKIFKTLGDDLQKRREVLGFSLIEVERNIHIRQHYLKALEAGDLNGLPSPVQGRGMLQNYAAFLGLDVEAVLLTYANGLQAQLAEKQAKQPARVETRPRRSRVGVTFSRFIPGDWMLGAILIAAVSAFVIWGVIRISAMQTAEEPIETVPPIVDALQATPGGGSQDFAEVTGTPAEDSSELDNSPVEELVPVPPSPQANLTETPVPTVSDAPVQVYISVLRRAWMRVTVDGEIEFEGRVIPGGAYSFAGDFQIEVLTGNGAGLQVFFNGIDLGVLGVYGEVVTEVFTPEGVLQPTPTSTPIPTSTPEPSPTQAGAEEP
jgi:cytoskeletal protein RodZ